MKVALHTLGCKVNQYESQVIAQQFVSRGYDVVGENEIADVYVVNTCSVTNTAERKSRQYIRRMKKKNPNAVIAITGCYLQRLYPSISELYNDADVFCGINNKYKIVELVEGAKSYKDCKPTLLDSYENLKDYMEAPNLPFTENKTRALIKVQEGCNRFCSYCIIPYARGKVRSRPLKNIVDEAKQLISKGHKELVLTGINTALYGAENDFESTCLEEYPEYINGDYKGIEIVINELNKLPGDFRIRLSSLEPTVVNSDYVKRLFKYDKLCHHLHMSLQSGCDKTLKDMNRKYTVAEYLDLVQVLRDFDPLYGLSTDIIVGYFGETNQDFSEGTLNTIEKAEFSRIHGFTFSFRPNTSAVAKGEPITNIEKKQRMDALKIKSDIVTDRFVKKCIQTKQKILFEEIVEIEGDEFYTGYTDNYLKAYLYKLPGEKDDKILNNFIDCVVVKKIYDGIEVRR